MTFVPSRQQLPFCGVDGVRYIAPNHSPKQVGDHKHYCIVCAGKTAMDSAVWLLNNSAKPGASSGVCPRRS